MENNDANTIWPPGKHPDDLLKSTEVVWQQSKEDVWANMQQRLSENKGGRTKQLPLGHRFWQYAAAAIIVLMLGTTAFMRFYTNKVYCPAGQHLTHSLPDGSTVALNANTTLSYAPLWWYLSREASLDGEAFFSVAKGRAFSVQSALGTTQVLGTSFNIYSRTDSYHVTCLTGKVQVKALASEQSVLLLPNQKVAVGHKGDLAVSEQVQAEQLTSWMHNEFVFTSRPLGEVFNEISRQYNVRINLKVKADSSRLYSGNFTKSNNIEDVLGIVCMPFNLNFTKMGSAYAITTAP